jgi:phospholipid transport system substrate-binding protein
MSLRVLLVVFLTFFYLPILTPADAATSDASGQLKAILGQLNAVLTRVDLRGDAHYNERARLIRRIISENFLTNDMADRCIEGYSNRLSVAQRAEFQKLFTRLFVYTYGSMALDFPQKGDVEFGPETKDGSGAKVETFITQGGTHIPVNYIMVQKSGQWFIRDVEIDGMSIMENYRKVFRNVVARSSFTTLLNQMQLQSRAVD